MHSVKTTRMWSDLRPVCVLIVSTLSPVLRSYYGPHRNPAESAGGSPAKNAGCSSDSSDAKAAKTW